VAKTSILPQKFQLLVFEGPKLVYETCMGDLIVAPIVDNFCMRNSIVALIVDNFCMRNSIVALIVDNFV
jgi:hypothetical protein